MDREWLRILAVVALGILVPQLAAGVMSRPSASDPPALQETVPLPTETVPAETAPPEPFRIPVVTDAGVVEMALEEYIRGVVLAEMPAYFEEEALMAQAIAARTYALRHMRIGRKHEEGAVCTRSSCCQAYLTDEEYLEKRGNVKEREKIAQAVAATAGLVLTYKGELADTTYFAGSGGRTEDAAAVWGSEIPYLQAVDSPGEEGTSAYEHSVYFETELFADLLDRELVGAPEQWIGAVTYTDGGGVDTIIIGGITYTGKELRKNLGLRSTAFTMIPDEWGITVVTKGYGHRVGMSQYGANAMALAGSTYAQILAHYYQGTAIDKMGEIG
ncbi:MAG: stage II sporulation protein D [Ruminococcaceae bacterium]|nr:stage II sporulation protein D [Oscillospiraceae bacterium]